MNQPTLGDRQSTRVTVENNDDANGVWRLYSNSPEATNGGQMLAIEEQPGLSISVELVIERGGESVSLLPRLLFLDFGILLCAW